jgi:uncharacterized membrane protein YkvA (DUF1232 family)
MGPEPEDHRRPFSGRPFSGPPFSGRPFSETEIAEMRRLARDEEHLGHRLFTLLKKAARNLPFAVDAMAAWHCARDPATPARVRIVLLSAVAYFVMPIDMLPDFAPLLGFTDDAAVIAAAIATVAGAIKPEHREAAERSLRDLA